MSKSYSVLAGYYDNFTHNDCDYLGWSQYLFGVAKKHGATRIVDLACGTGKMTQLLCKGGLKLVGVDASREMLSQATQKCNALFVCQDMTKLQLTTAVDMAVCVNDGVNYLPPNRLTAFFQTVASNLKVGAPFVFDTSSVYKLTQVVANNVFYVDEENATLLWTNKLKSDAVTMTLTLFERQGDVYRRQEETHTQYLHSVRFVTQSLNQAGFDLVEVTADYGKPLTDESLRVTFYAIKR